ncbi:Crp/Fnr family transcriptional regulator, partial [Methylobacterium sp. E-025]|uniref:Crp/Fnr family transcriptional regulator n=1 Tax=Methylobacterium sp. E-025 TaxID=2836561 RepID=UPI001FB97DC1
RKLEGFEDLSDDDRRALDGLAPHIRQVAARVALGREGDEPENAHLLLDGLASRYKMLPDGKRQSMALRGPGHFCRRNVFILDQMDHNIATISACHVVDIPRRAIEEITQAHPQITRAFWWCGLVDEAVLREWLVNLGGRAPERRIAHFLCEMLVRLDAVGKVTNDSYAFPFTQVELADAMGLSAVHVHRTLRELRDLGLITIKRRVLTIHDVEQLKSFSGFTPNYLHLKNTRWGARRSEPWLNQLRES